MLPAMRLLAPACVMALALLAAACGTESGGLDAPDVPWHGQGRVLQFVVPEISCTGCVAEVQKRLGALAAVEAVEADAESKEVRVTLKEGASRDEAKREIPPALAQGSGKRFSVKGLPTEPGDSPDGNSPDTTPR
jgi:copper chaperone CopZ